jgi:hypothetical protein
MPGVISRYAEQANQDSLSLRFMRGYFRWTGYLGAFATVIGGLGWLARVFGNAGPWRTTSPLRGLVSIIGAGITSWASLRIADELTDRRRSGAIGGIAVLSMGILTAVATRGIAAIVAGAIFPLIGVALLLANWNELE